MIPWEIPGQKKLLGFRKFIAKWNRKRIGSYFDHQPKMEGSVKKQMNAGPAFNYHEGVLTFFSIDI